MILVIYSPFKIDEYRIPGIIEPNPDFQFNFDKGFPRNIAYDFSNCKKDAKGNLTEKPKDMSKEEMPKFKVTETTIEPVNEITHRSGKWKAEDLPWLIAYTQHDPK